MKNNKGLVEYAQRALAEKWGYVWGTFGNELTPKLFEAKIKQYPNEVGRYKDFISRTWLHRKTSDCVGLIKSYMWFEDGTIKYDAKTDVSANGMFERAKEKGSIETMPEIKGLLVWKKGHIGIYIGNGWVIEANSTRKGVIKTPLKGTGSTAWTNWLKCPFITYETEKPKEPPKPAVLKEGDKGEAVKILQLKLNQLGFPCAADGDFGAKTKAAVIALQKKNKLDPDGVVGPKTQSVLDRG